VLGGNLELELAGLADDAHQATAKEAWEQRHRRVIEAGGLHVLGTERNESRRVDNQLRGRCGRQGDPGSSQFYLSLEDNLMRIFGSERIAGLMQKLGMEEGEAIEHPWVTRAIENAQTKVEGHNFDARKQLLEYDDVANEQRKVIYRQRDMLMETDDIADTIAEMRGEVLAGVIDRGIPPGSMEEQWDVAALEHELETELGVKMPLAEWLERDHSLHEETLRRKIEQAIADMMTAKEARVGAENMRHFEKAVMLKVLDEQWKEHLFNMDHLRQGIHLRGYAQKNPKQEYKREAFEMFTALMENVKFEVTSLLARLHIPNEEEIREMEARRRRQSMRFIHAEAEAPTADADTAATPPAPPGAPSSLSQPSQPSQPFVRTGKKIGRNEPCPCGSGKKFKQCHGKI